MYNFNFFSIINRLFLKKYIKNIELPVCSKCVYFIENKINYSHNSITDNYLYGRCKKFGEINIVTGVIEHDFAYHCRMNNYKCGNSGKEYVDNVR